MTVAQVGAGPPLISVVVATYNAAGTLASCIDSILDQTYEPLELLIVDDGSTDGTADLLAQHPRRRQFTVLTVENGGQARARNLGVDQASGEWLGFFDSDCLLDPRCIEKLHEATGDEKVASVGGIQISPDDESAYGRAIQSYFESLGFLTEYVRKGRVAEVTETAHNPSCNVLYRRSAFEEVGGFDERLWVGEDPDLDQRVALSGYRHLCHSGAIVQHYRSSSASAFGRKMWAYGRGQMHLVRNYGFRRTIHFVPVAVVAGALLLAAGLWWSPRFTLGGSVAVVVVGLGAFEVLRYRSGLGWVFYQLLGLNVGCWLSGFFQELIRPKLA